MKRVYWVVTEAEVLIETDSSTGKLLSLEVDLKHFLLHLMCTKNTKN